MSTAAVWGATGFVGRQLVEKLSASGWRVRALVRDVERHGSDFPAGIEVQRLEMNSTASEMVEKLQGVDVVFHCAGHGDDSRLALDTFVSGTALFAQAAAASGAFRYIQLSTVAVYGGDSGSELGAGSPTVPITAYAINRLSAELQARSAFADSPERCIVVRIPMVVGSSMRSGSLRSFFKVLRDGLFIHPGPEEAVLNCIGVQRLSSALVLLASKNLDRLATICQFSDNVRWSELVALYSREEKRSVRRIPVPRALALGRFAVLANDVVYKDDSTELGFASELPDTREDLVALIHQSSGSSIQGSTLLSVTAINLLARLGAGLLPVAIAWNFGATAVTDALFWVFSAVLFLGAAFSNALETVVVPWASRMRRRLERKDWLFGPVFVMALLSILSTGIFLFGNAWLMRSGLLLQGESASLAESYLRQCALVIVFMTLSGFWSGVYLSRSQYFLPAASLSLKWWSILGALLLMAANGNIALLGYSFLIGEVFRALLLSRVAIRNPDHVHQPYKWRTVVRDFPWAAFGSLFLTSILLHTGPMIDRLMASWLGHGAMSLFEYAWTAYLIPSMLFTSGYLIIVYSEVSNRLASSDFFALRKWVASLDRHLWVFSAWAVGVLWVCILAAKYFELALGSLSAEDLSKVGSIALVLSVGLPFSLMNVSYSRLLTAMDKTVLILKAAAAKILLNVIGNLLLIDHFGLVGLAISTAVSEAASALVMRRYVRQAVLNAKELHR